MSLRPSRLGCISGPIDINAVDMTEPTSRKVLGSTKLCKAHAKVDQSRTDVCVLVGYSGEDDHWEGVPELHCHDGECKEFKLRFLMPGSITTQGVATAFTVRQ